MNVSCNVMFPNLAHAKANWGAALAVVCRKRQVIQTNPFNYANSGGGTAWASPFMAMGKVWCPECRDLLTNAGRAIIAHLEAMDWTTRATIAESARRGFESNIVNARIARENAVTAFNTHRASRHAEQQPGELNGSGRAKAFSPAR